MLVVESVVELIGRTPMIRLGAMKEPGEADIYAKLEYLNPGMSVKDRTALGLIRAAEESGALKPGGTVPAEPAGNTGAGPAPSGVPRGAPSGLSQPQGPGSMLPQPGADAMEQLPRVGVGGLDQERHLARTFHRGAVPPVARIRRASASSSAGRTSRWLL